MEFFACALAAYLYAFVALVAGETRLSVYAFVGAIALTLISVRAVD